MKFAFVDAHRGEFPVDDLCRVMGVTRSGYYAWRNRPPSATARRRAELDQAIRAARAASRSNDGSPRGYRDLRAGGVRCCENTVARRMRACGLRAKTTRRFHVRTTDARHGHAVAPNRLKRQFRPARPDQVWAADITYIPTEEGWLYLAAVVDLCSRQVVGWATADHLRAELATQALERAVARRRPPRALLHHSDRGVQYACDAYRRLLERHGLEASMSRPGNCYDNAVVESFFGTLKKELVHHAHYPTRAAAHQALFEYIEVFYNRRRRHSALGYVSPAEFEARLN